MYDITKTALSVFQKGTTVNFFQEPKRLGVAFSPFLLEPMLCWRSVYMYELLFGDEIKQLELVADDERELGMRVSSFDEYGIRPEQKVGVLLLMVDTVDTIIQQSIDPKFDLGVTLTYFNNTIKENYANGDKINVRDNVLSTAYCKAVLSERPMTMQSIVESQKIKIEEVEDYPYGFSR
jgi:hypothetical protein